MKKIILIITLATLLIPGFSQEKKDIQLGISLSYSSLNHIDLEPFAYTFFQTISPGLKLTQKKHTLGINYDFVSPTYLGPLKYGPFTAIQKQFPKGISTFYRYTYFQRKTISAFAGLDLRYLRYYISSNGQLFNFSQSKQATRGFQSYFINVGPHAGLRAKWKSMSIDMSINFSSVFFHSRDLTENQVGTESGSLLVLNGGLTYWINK
jgi:hypothetical protein